MPRAKKTLRAELHVKNDVKAMLRGLRIYNLIELAEAVPPTATINGFYFMPVQTGYGVAGISDFVLVIGGVSVYVETKQQVTRGHVEATARQQFFIQCVQRAGGIGWVIDNAAYLRALLIERFPWLQDNAILLRHN